MNNRRASPDAAGDVVRRRLEALVAEIAPQRHPTGPDVPSGTAGPRAGGPWAPDAPPDPEALDPDPPDADPPDADRSGDAFPAPRRAAPREARRLLARGWEFGRAHLAVVAILGLVGVAWSVLGMTQARTVPVQVTATPVPAAIPSPTPTPEPLQVHVVGAVTHPGVVRLTPGARVGDALEAAGGPTREARLGDLNLAALVADGAQVVVGGPGRPDSEVRDGTESAGAAAGTTGAPVNLNTATLEQLDALPGVGPVTAQSILAWRAQHQRFTRVDELQEVDGIGAKTMERLRPHVRV